MLTYNFINTVLFTLRSYVHALHSFASFYVSLFALACSLRSRDNKMIESEETNE